MKISKRILFVLGLGLPIFANAQGTGTCTVLQQPCNNNGTLAVHITSGLTPPISYNYYGTNGFYASHNNVNSLYDTLHGSPTAITTVYAYDANGNSYQENSTGMVLPFSVDPPTFTDAVCPNLTGTAQYTINGGSMPSSIQWFEISNYGVGPVVGTSNPITLPPGDYGAIISDGGCFVNMGSDSINSVTIQNISGLSFNVTSTIASCTNGTATVSGITGGMSPYTYLWSNGATSATASGLSQGFLSVTVTDAQGCSDHGGTAVSQSVSIAGNPVTTNATCLQNDGVITCFGSGGTPPYAFFYSNGMSGQTISGLSGGTSLNINITDANGCTGTDYAYIITTTPIYVTYSTTTSSCTAPTGSATLTIAGGTAPYTVAWNAPAFLGGPTITGLAPGNYSFNVIDAAGCTQSGTVTITPTSVINANISALSPVCPATTGSVFVNATGTTPPFTYLWSNGNTTSTLSSVPTGYYSCVISDAAGCSVTKSSGLYAVSPVSLGLSTTAASCLYSTDGSAFAAATGGTAPYTYSWSNGQTGATASGLASNNYYVYSQDANGCSANNFTFVGYNAANTSCYCTISGRVFTDLNGNCAYDAGEQGIENIMIHCAPFGSTFTNASGFYSFNLPSGNYTLSENVQATYPLAACQSNSIPVNVTVAAGCSNTINFANNINTLHDIHLLRTRVDNAIPGNAHTQALLVKNDGTVNESNIQLAYRNDGQIAFNNTTPLSYSQPSAIAEPNWYDVTSGFSLAPGASTIVYFNSNVATNVPLGTNLFFKDTAAYAAPVSNWLNDYSPWNNVQNYNETVIGSYDPNFKEVSPKGAGPQGFITTADAVLDYVVHFQNTGSYYAEKVVIKDTLDSDLDWSTIQLGVSDHAYTATLSENGVLTFTFTGIHLDWQSSNEMASRGFVSYSIKQNASLTIGTQIKNKAAIYFDFNAPVLTNQTLNTIQAPFGIADDTELQNLSIYPNPAPGELNIDLGSITDAANISIYDLQGRVVISEDVNRNGSIQKLNVANLVTGLYFVQVEKTNGQKLVKKFVKD